MSTHKHVFCSKAGCREILSNYRAKLPRDLYKASCIIVVKVGETLDRSAGGPCVSVRVCVCVEAEPFYQG